MSSSKNSKKGELTLSLVICNVVSASQNHFLLEYLWFFGDWLLVFVSVHAAEFH
jgi:hypothetical protein